MAKRVTPGERPYNPVNEGLVRSVMSEKVEQAPQPAFHLAKPNPQERTQARSATIERLEREKRFLVTESEDSRLNRLVGDLAVELGTPVKLSHLVRGALRMLMDTSDQIIDAARGAPPLQRPANGDLPALADFEHKISMVLKKGIYRSRSRFGAGEDS